MDQWQFRMFNRNFSATEYKTAYTLRKLVQEQVPV